VFTLRALLDCAERVPLDNETGNAAVGQGAAAGAGGGEGAGADLTGEACVVQ
jgi:hypothetical protein